MAILKSKTIEVSDITYGELTLLVRNNILYYYRRYSLADAEGNDVGKYFVPEGQLQIDESMEWSKVPKNIQDVLIEIDEYTKNKIREQEGLK
jgi:hypothetical protein